MKIACCVEAARESPGPARRIVAGRQCRERPRSQKERVRDRALLGCSSLPESEWDYANGYKQNQKRHLERCALITGLKQCFTLIALLAPSRGNAPIRAESRNLKA